MQSPDTTIVGAHLPPDQAEVDQPIDQSNAGGAVHVGGLRQRSLVDSRVVDDDFEHAELDTGHREVRGTRLEEAHGNLMQPADQQAGLVFCGSMTIISMLLYIAKEAKHLILAETLHGSGTFGHGTQPSIGAPAAGTSVDPGPH